MQIEALEKRKNAWKRWHDFLFLYCQDFVKEKRTTTIMILRVQYSCESMKIHGNGVNICVFFVHFTDHQSVIYVPCPRSGHPTRASNSFKKGCKNPSFVQSLVQNKKQQQKIEFKGRRRGQNKVGSLLSVKVKCLFYCYLFTNPRDLDKKLWVAQCQSHLNITEN